MTLNPRWVQSPSLSSPVTTIPNSKSPDSTALACKRSTVAPEKESSSKTPLLSVEEGGDPQEQDEESGGSGYGSSQSPS